MRNFVLSTTQITTTNRIGYNSIDILHDLKFIVNLTNSKNQQCIQNWKCIEHTSQGKVFQKIVKDNFSTMVYTLKEIEYNDHLEMIYGKSEFHNRMRKVVLK